MKSWLQVWFAGAAGGLLGGGTVGILEGVYLLVSTAEVTDYQAMPYGGFLYGLLGLAIGLAATLPLHLLSVLVRHPLRRAWAWSLGWSLAFCGPGLAIAVWVARRDYFGEVLPPPTVLGELFAVFALAGLFALVVGAGLVERTMLRALAKVPGALLLYGGTITFLTLMHVGSGHMGAAELPGRAIPDSLVDRPSVLLIGIDSLRADHVGCYGSEAGLTPALDALADVGVVYEQTVSQSSWGRAAFASLLTGMFPSSNGAFRRSDRLPAEVDTLAEVLSDAGYLTGARVNDADISTRFGFHQGFDDFVYLQPQHPFGARESSYFLVLYTALRTRIVDRMTGRDQQVSHHYRDAGEVTAAGADFMRAHVGERFMLFLHYRDPHEPYFPHPYDGSAAARVYGETPAPSQVEEIEELYAGEVAHTDEYLGALWRYLREEGLWDELLIVVTANHGQEFADHGDWWDGSSLFEEQVRVPLVVKYPAGTTGPSGALLAGTRAAGQVRSIDVAPTLVELAGVEVPRSWQGVSLMGPWSERDARDKLAFSELDLDGNVLASVRTAEWKLIEARADGARGLPECGLFHLAVDPGETENRCGSEDLEDHRRALHGELVTIKATARGRAVPGSELNTGPEECRELQALGYVESSVDCGAL